MASYLLQAIELGLSLPKDSLLRRVAQYNNDLAELRFNHYPPIARRELTTSGTKTRRIWPHTDLGILTLVVVCGGGDGLEFENRRAEGSMPSSLSRLSGLESREDGTSFLPIHFEDSTDLLVNVSDILERWTNGELRAGLHRVNAPETLSKKEKGSYNDDTAADSDDGHVVLPSRYSAVFLYRPGAQQPVGPMSSFVSEPERPKLYTSVTHMRFLEENQSLVYGT